MTNYILVFAIAISIFNCNQQTQLREEIAKWEEQAERITIIRDDYGVPHIYGKTDADAVFGLLYAQCEDDFPRVERNYIWAIGRLAEVEGEDQLYSDLRARLYMTKEEAIENYNNSPDWLKQLCNAFADGVNYYLHTHPEVKPALLTRFEPWMPMYFSEGSIGGDIERVSVQKIKNFYEQKAGLSINSLNHQLDRLDFDEEPKGSNGIALAGSMTESGNAMLLINPHTSFYFRGEVHVVSEEGLNAYGAVTWGQFFVYQGFNEKTGWMHTSTYTDVIDEFMETIEESEDGKKVYLYGNEKRPVQEFRVQLKYKEGEEMKEKSFPIYRTHHGPITHMVEDKWIATALMWKPIEALTQSYTRTKLSNHGEFQKMMQILTNSSNNTVFADAEGNIAYYHGNFIPVRDTKFDYTKPVDGRNPDTDWTGLHPVKEAITILNPPNGWIQNCNSTPFTAAAEHSPKKDDYPEYMSIDRENFRGIHAIRLLKKADNLTLDQLIELAYDPYLTGFEKLIPGLIEAYDRISPTNPTMKAAIEELRKWDYKVSETSIAMSLAHFYGTLYYQKGRNPMNLSRMKLVNYLGTFSPIEERLSIFEQTLDQLTNDFGRWDTPWGEINRLQRLNGKIQSEFDDDQPSLPVGLASGRWGALAAYGARAAKNTKRLYGYRGNSFVAVVEFGDKVKAKSMLAGGQNSDPNSPHFFDQGKPYVDTKFKEVAYYRDDVESKAERTYQPGK